VAFKKLLFKLEMKMKSDIQISPCTSATIAAMQCWQPFFSRMTNLNTKMWITFCKLIWIVQKNNRIFVSAKAMKLMRKNQIK